MKIRSVVLVLLVLLLGAVSVHATPADWQSQFEQIIHDEMAYYNVPGAAVAVIHDGAVIYAQGFGQRDTVNNLPFTTETRFRVGSTTKSMTSFLLARLVDEGLLSWDTPVTDLFPDFATADPALTERILARDLMGMATGLVSTDFDAFDWGGWTIDDLLSAIRRQRIDGEFRASHHYNNEVYALAGYAGVVASGAAPTLENFAALMQSRVFDPIGMTSAIITDDHARLGDNFAEPHEPDLLAADDNALARMIDPPIAFVTPAGGVWVNLEDMAKYVITQMNGGVAPDGTRIVSEAALAETWSPGAAVELGLPGIADAHYAMGWITQTYKDIPMRWHNGGWSGYGTQMAIFPESDVAILVFSNSSLGGQFNDALVYSFAELWHDLPVEAAPIARLAYATVTAQLRQIRNLVDGEIEAEAAAPLVGTYENDWVVEYRPADSSLWVLHGAWSFRLTYIPLGRTYFVINNGGLGGQITFDTTATPVTMTITAGMDAQIILARTS